jgi:hypothetical protein
VFVDDVEQEEINTEEDEAMVWFMVFNAPFNNISVISWRSVLLVEEMTYVGFKCRKNSLVLWDI